MTRKTSILTGFVVFAAVVLGVGAAAWWHFTGYAKTPADPDAVPRLVNIPSGTGTDAVAALLHKRGVIEHSWKFKVLIRLDRRRGGIKAGQYRLSAAMTPAEILDKLIRGDVVLHKLTVPEGYTVKQVGRLVDSAGLADKETFLKAAADPDFAAEKGIPADTFEGYLFPETYFFPVSAGPRKIIATMVDRFFTVFSEKYKKRAQELGFSMHEIVTLASMIEKETGAPRERPKIASVFHNRLEKGMRLASDPTVIYGIADFDGNLTRRHLNTPTPYNTYLIRGLPPGPIANPGEKSLKAALYPADTDYLYFVAKDNGTHAFSTNISDHNRAVEKYQLHR